MKKRIVQVFALVLVCAMLMPITAFADMGPKPSVTVTFTGAEDEIYYATLLSKCKSTGPAWAYDPNDRDSYQNIRGDQEIWQTFVDYQDADGYYFLQEFWECSQTEEFCWGYYPPSPFKILVYFPEHDWFVVSPIYERYAFDSYFTVDLSEWSVGQITAEKSYDYSQEMNSLVARILITILLEIVLALIWGYRKARLMALITGVNVVTQIALNVALNLSNYRQGHGGLFGLYLMLEFFVFVIEANLYYRVFPRLSPEHPGLGKRAVWYALAANVLSFAAGWIVIRAIPGIF